MQLAQRLAGIRAAVCYSCATDWDHFSHLPGALRELFHFAAGRWEAAEWAGLWFLAFAALALWYAFVHERRGRA